MFYCYVMLHFIMLQSPIVRCSGSKLTPTFLILYFQNSHFNFNAQIVLVSLPIMDIIGRKMKETEGESGKKPTHHRPTRNSKYNKNKSYGLIDYKDRAILD